MAARCFKLFAAVAVMVLAAVPAFAAGSSTTQAGTLQGDGIAITTVTFTADDTDGSIPTLVVGIPGQSYIFKVVTNPGATAPTDNWDVVITDADGADLLGGAGLNRDEATSETAYPLSGTTPVYAYVAESPTIAITGNSVNDAVGTVVIYSIPQDKFTGQLGASIPLNSAVLNTPAIDSPTITGPITLPTSGSDITGGPLTRYGQTVTGWETDFLGNSGTTAAPPFVMAAVASGGNGSGTIDENHPGVVQYRATANANSGYNTATNAASMLLGGGEKFIAIAKILATATTVNTVLVGFYDTATITAPTDGCWIEVVDTTATGYCKNNDGPTATATTYTITLGAWYVYEVSLNSTASMATFTIRSTQAGAALWTSTVAANIPTGAGRLVGAGVLATNSQSSGTINLLDLDYIHLSIDRTLAR